MARLVSGHGLHADYTPSGSDVANGDLVVIGDVVGMADEDITDGVKGAVLISDCVIAVEKDTGSSSAISDGAQCYWDSGNEVATTTASTNKKLGVSVDGGGGASDEEVYIALGHHVA